jgi:hypothetical protein
VAFPLPNNALPSHVWRVRSASSGGWRVVRLLVVQHHFWLSLTLAGQGCGEGGGWLLLCGPQRLCQRRRLRFCQS